jgi:hypothetical protein
LILIDFKRAITELKIGWNDKDIDQAFTKLGGTRSMPITSNMIDTGIEDTLKSTID